MRLNGSNANAELVGDFLVTAALRNEHQDLPFAAGKLSERLFLSAIIYQLIEGSLGNFGAEESIAVMHRLDRVQQFVRRRAFGNITVGAGLDDPKEVLLVAVHRKDEDLDLGGILAQSSRHRQAIPAGHGDIQ